MSDVHDYSLVATARTLREVLAVPGVQPSTPAYLALRAIERAFHSDVRGAIALLRRALTMCSAASEDAAYITDLLAQFYVSTGEFRDLELILRDCASVPVKLLPAIVAMNGILYAVSDDAPASRKCAEHSMKSAREAHAPRILGRVLCRCSLAAYYRGDYDEARNLSLDAVRVLEGEAAYWTIAASLSIAASIAQDWHQDAQLAAKYYARMRLNAELAEHEAIRRTAIAASFNVAAEMFDKTAFDATRLVLIARPESQQHQENFLLMIGEALGLGWKNQFAAADALLTAAGGASGISQSQRALIESLLALIAAANWDVELARARSRAALRRTVGAEREPLYDRRHRALARLLSAATCFIIGDIVRGQRSLCARYDPGHEFRQLFSSDAIDLSSCPELFRGYAEFINAASARARRSRPRHKLTIAEADLLAVLQHGSTVAEMATEFNKSKHTVARQLESIYEKLGARNRAQAVQKARELGLIQ